MTKQKQLKKTKKTNTEKINTIKTVDNIVVYFNPFSCNNKIIRTSTN